VKTQVDNILQETTTALAQHGFNDQVVNGAVEALQALEVETVAEREIVLLAFVQLMDILLPHVPADSRETVQAQRNQIQATYDNLFGPDAPYSAINHITIELAEGLKQGGSPDELVARASAKLDDLSYGEGDAVLATEGQLRLIALNSAHNWFQQISQAQVGELPIVTIIRELAEALRQNGFDKTLILDAFRALENQPAETVDDQQNIASGLLHVWGMGLWSKPEAAPLMEPLRDRLIELSAQLATEESTSEVTTVPSEGKPSQCEIILGELASTLEREGFSEYALQQAMTAIQELPNESEEDYKIIHEGLLRMIDIATPYAPEEAAQSLMITRSTIEQQGDLNAFADRQFAPGEMRAECQAIVDELRDSLKAGELPSPAITRAMMKFTTLSQHLQEDDEESGKVLMKTMLKEFFEVLQPYVPEGSENPFQEMMAMMDVLDDAVDASDSDDEVRKAVFETQANEQFGRASQIFDARNVPAMADLSPHIRQFLELIPVFMERTNNPMLREHTGPGDKAEIERLRKRLDQPMRMMRAATTEAQIIRHQREGLRRVVLEFGQFERRHHLMLVHPAFPTNSVTADPNDVFFSGSDSVAELVKQACETLGMDLVGKHSSQNKTYGRWQQLRASGVAVFDYSFYDPALADPAGPIKRSSKGEAKVLGAAGTVAMVAYETGWAYVLGKPMVIVARKGKAVPFDVDIEPVLLEEDGRDVERIIAAMQTALYGVQHGMPDDCLAETLREVRRLYVEHPKAKTLLAGLTDVNDATGVRMALAAALDRIEEENPLLVIPAFAGSYPIEGRRELFHIAAFRDWSKVAQEEVRMACERAGVAYGIGYERIHPDIIRTIWNDICRASFVIADITNLNPNAVLELAMAQAIGRPTLILTQNSQPHVHFPAVQKVRTHQYNPDKGRADLSSLLDDFLGAQ
jgi:hypothetical protein